jgi:hypothetical protein
MFSLQDLSILGLLTLTGGAVMYIILCADPNSNSILGKLHRVLYRYFPIVLKKFGIDKFCSGFFNYLCNTNHPLVQIFYLLVAVGGFILYEITGFLEIFPNS